MTAWPDADDLHRTAKILLDNEIVDSPVEAIAMLEGFVLQVAVGPGVHTSAAAQAALATIVNAGRRAFLGGVAVRADADPVLTEGWVTGLRLSTTVALFGGRIVTELRPDLPTVVVGEPAVTPVGSIILWTTWSGWAGGVVEDQDRRLPGGGMVLSGVTAGALGVSETFQFSVKSTLTAGRREVGVSLWRPDLPWRDLSDPGPELAWLPSRLWILGLGHLGQGYSWSLGWLPFDAPADVLVYLMDVDSVVAANVGTGLLLRGTDVNRRKTRVIAERMEALGMGAAIVDRRFDEYLWPVEDEPTLALAGFDSPEPRRLLGGERSGEPRFARVIDCGLGRGQDYTGMLIQTFPSQGDPATAFATRERSGRGLPAAYLAEIERRVREGEDRGTVTCGMTDIAGITVGAAFVGATAGALVMADVLRYLNGGIDFAVLALDLRSPTHVDAAPNTAPGPFVNTGSIPAR